MTTEDKEYIKSVIYGWFSTPDRLNPNSVFNQSIDGHEDFVFIIKTTKGWQSWNYINWSNVVQYFTKIDLPQNINIQEVDTKLLPIVRNLKIKEILK
jgi:hypothetical protein